VKLLLPELTQLGEDAVVRHTAAVLNNTQTHTDMQINKNMEQMDLAVQLCTLSGPHSMARATLLLCNSVIVD